MGVTHTQQTPVTEEQLAADWPGWRIWRADNGWWCATRGRTLSGAELDADLAHTLVEDDGPTLLRKLRAQEEIASSLAAA